jgi:hypothetical protein
MVLFRFSFLPRYGLNDMANCITVHTSLTSMNSLAKFVILWAILSHFSATQYLLLLVAQGAEFPWMSCFAEFVAQYVGVTVHFSRLTRIPTN